MGATSTFAFYLVPILFAVTCSSSALKKDDCSVALAAAGQGIVICNKPKQPEETGRCGCVYTARKRVVFQTRFV